MKIQKNVPTFITMDSLALTLIVIGFTIFVGAATTLLTLRTIPHSSDVKIRTVKPKQNIFRIKSELERISPYITNTGFNWVEIQNAELNDHFKCVIWGLSTTQQVSDVVYYNVSFQLYATTNQKVAYVYVTEKIVLPSAVYRRNSEYYDDYYIGIGTDMNPDYPPMLYIDIPKYMWDILEIGDIIRIETFPNDTYSLYAPLVHII